MCYRFHVDLLRNKSSKMRNLYYLPNKNTASVKNPHSISKKIKLDVYKIFAYLYAIILRRKSKQ